MPKRETLAVFGASGRTGVELSKAARERGFSVRALVRPETAVPPELSSTEIVRGDFSDTDAVEAVVTGAGAVCCVFGPRPPSTDVFCAAATRAVLAAMKCRGARRLLCQTGAMIGEDRSHLSPPLRWMARAFARSRPEVAEDRREQEALVRASDLDWTLVKPPRLVGDGARFRVRSGVDLRIGLLSSISRADLAVFLLDEIERPRYVRQAVFVKG